MKSCSCRKHYARGKINLKSLNNVGTVDSKELQRSVNCRELLPGCMSRDSKPLCGCVRRKRSRDQSGWGRKELDNTSDIILSPVQHRRRFPSNTEPWIRTLWESGKTPLLTSRNWPTFWTGGLKRPEDGEKLVSLRRLLCPIVRAVIVLVTTDTNTCEEDSHDRSNNNTVEE